MAIGDENLTEDIELAGLLEWHAAVMARAIPGCDWRLERSGAALCSVSAAEPSILINRALLHGRLRDVIEAGCTTVVTMTGEAVPGDPQHSCRNILKAVFREAHVRHNWIPADAA